MEIKLKSSDELLSMPPDCYMNAEQLAFFERLLLSMREDSAQLIEQIKQQIASVGSEIDMFDQAMLEEENRQRMRLADRHRRMLAKIDSALSRIRCGTYGYCVHSGHEIGLPRLLARPVAELSVEEKSRQEMRERNYSHQR
ncbi:MAG: TraR/DksA family transcriptional regulator [Pseudomonadota bacterium]